MRKTFIFTLVGLTFFLFSCGEGSKKELSENDTDSNVVSDSTSDSIKTKYISNYDATRDSNLVANYDEWKRYTYKDIIILYPEGHPHEENLHQMAIGYISARTFISNFFRIEEPKDTLLVYYYTGFGQGRGITKHKNQFVDGNKLHFWQPGYLGTVFTEYMITKWRPQEPSFKFLKHGLMRLFDYSGRDYHELALNNIDDGTSLSLTDLAVDTVVNAHAETHNSAQACSFVAYLLDHHGLEGLELLYGSKLTFDESVQKFFMKSAAEMEKEWIAYTNKLYDEKIKRINNQ